MLYTHRYVSLRRRQNLDRIGSDHGPDHEPDYGPDLGRDHGSEHGSDKDWIADQIILIEIRYFARQVKIKSA